MFRFLLAVAIALLAIANMTSQALPSIIYYVCVVLALATLVQYRFAGTKVVSANNKLALWCLSAPIFAIVFSVLVNGIFPGSDLEIALRWLLGAWLVLLALSYLSLEKSRLIILGYIVAALAATMYVFYLTWPDWHRPNTNAVYNAVGYGNLTLLLAVITFLSIWYPFTRWHAAERLIKLAITVVALLAFVLTQTRTGWIATPIFALIAAHLVVPVKRPRRVIGIAVLIMVVLAGLFSISDSLRDRTVLAYNEAIECSGDGSITDSSICIRLQLWRASVDMIKQRPIAGFGKRSYFNDYLQHESQPKGLVSEYVAENWGEPHNDFFGALTTFGIPGGIALLFIYLGPACLFFRRMSVNNDAAIRTAAAMGLALCLGMLVFGQFEAMWRSMRMVSFYAVSLGLFLRLSDPYLANRAII